MRRHAFFLAILLMVLIASRLAFEYWIKRSKAIGAPRLNCVGNLKQIRLACSEYQQRFNVEPDSLVSLSTTGILESGKVYVCVLKFDTVPRDNQVAHSTYVRAPENPRKPAPVYYCEHDAKCVNVLFDGGSARRYPVEKYADIDWDVPE